MSDASNASDDDEEHSPLLKSLEKRLMSVGKSPNDAMAVFLVAAKWIPRSIHPFLNLTRVIYAGFRDADEVDVAEIEEPLEEELAANSLFMKLVPHFERVLKEVDAQPGLLHSFIKMLATTSNDARSEDTGSLRYAILSYIPKDVRKDTLEPPLLTDDSKALRGFHHPMTARLLCPMRLISDFDANPWCRDFMTHVQDGKIKIRTKHWLSFLYDEREYDREEHDKGLFKGFLLLRVYRHIFTSPSSAIGKVRKGTKPSKAQIYGMKCASGRTIAYACVQTRFLLSNLSSWSTVDGHFDLHAFYDNIVALFETNPHSRWVVETLNWWNAQVLWPKARGHKKAKTCEDLTESEDSGDDDILAKHRAEMQSSTDATRGRTAQRDQSHRSNGSQCSTSRRSRHDDPPHDQSHNPSPPRPPRHRSPSPPRPPRHRGRSRLGYTEDGPRGRSYQRNSSHASHATTNDDEPRQHSLSRDVNRRRRDPPTSPPQDAHASVPEGRRPHRRSSPDDDDDRSPRVRLSSKRKRLSTPPTSGMRSKKARTVVTSD